MDGIKVSGIDLFTLKPLPFAAAELFYMVFLRCGMYTWPRMLFYELVMLVWKVDSCGVGFPYLGGV